MAPETATTLDTPGPREEGGVESFQPNVKKHLSSIYAAHAGSQQPWTSDQTRDFIHKTQKLDTTVDDTAPLDLAGFLALMSRPEAAATLPRDDEDLSWPLAAYFISSSHNTYLSGNQLYSDSTTAAYADVLRRGCRCVEIDVWDGTGSDAESSASSSDEDAATGKQTHSKADRLAKLKASLPDSVVSRLSKSSTLRRKLERTTAASSHGLTDDAADRSLTGGGSASGSQASLAHEPRVLHGYTLTKEVAFRDVCAAIREHAFAATDLPLIVSLEVHCGAEQQAVMVDIINAAWGDVAVVAPPDNKTPPVLPSPADLRGKILVKVKYAPSHAAEDRELDRTDSDGPEKKNKKKPSKIIRALSDLGIYTRAVSFKSWAQPEATMPAHIFSLSEGKFAAHHHEADDGGAALFAHNREYMLRAYPSGLRVGSSNLNPAPFWAAGAQIVALNWQQMDEGMMLNEGMFAGTQGYVLKPPGYRPNCSSKPPLANNTIIRKTLSLSVTCFAAQHIPLPSGDSSDSGFRPYVKMELHVDGSPRHDLAAARRQQQQQDHAGEYKARTATAHGGGTDVDFKSQVLAFKGVPDVVEELAFVRFKVCDDEIGRDDLAAWACVRLDRLGAGYRFVHLRDGKGRLGKGVILVKVDKEFS